MCSEDNLQIDGRVGTRGYSCVSTLSRSTVGRVCVRVVLVRVVLPFVNRKIIQYEYGIEVGT